MSCDIAIIGMSCRLPGAGDVAAFWSMLREGREAIQFFPASELEANHHLVGNPNFVLAFGILDDHECFDAAFFGVSTSEARALDPQRRIFLECVWHAIEDAGCALDRYPGRVSLYAGQQENGYAVSGLQSYYTAEWFQSIVRSYTDYLATYVAFKLNLRGEAISVQTACSTGLVAVHLACQSLASYSSNVAIAGASSVCPLQKVGHLYNELTPYSRDGHCRAFDRDGTGIVMGNGACAVVLKRAEDAHREGDHIYALIKGSAVNNDGSSKAGFAEPSVQGQAEAVAEALAVADIPAESVSYIEAHGAATRLGDSIEVEAYRCAFGNPGAGSRCAIGTVKTNIGHLGPAAGIAGLIKTALALHHKEIPPSLHFKTPNEAIDLDATPFYVADRLLPWLPNGELRRAGVHSLGVGGTNAHVVMEEARPRKRTNRPRREEPQLVTLSAKSTEALASYRRALATWLRQHPDVALEDVAWTLNTGRCTFDRRWATTAGSTAELISRLEAEQPEREVVTTPAPRHGSEAPGPAASRSPEQLARAWLAGHKIPWDELYADTSHLQRVPLTTYPFQRKAHRVMPGDGDRKASVRSDGDSGPFLLLLSGDELEGLRVEAAHLAQLAGSPDAVSSAADLCLAASARQLDRGHRLAIVADSREQLCDGLIAFDQGAYDGNEVFYGDGVTSRCDIVLVFSGFGGMWPGMARELTRREAVFRDSIGQCSQALQAWMDLDLVQLMAGDEPGSDDIRINQPIYFAYQVALAALWRSWGVVPSAVVGHSSGELAAAHVAGILSLDDAMRVVVARSRLLHEQTGTAAMVLAASSSTDVAKLLASLAARPTRVLEIAARNGPRSTVVAGDLDSIEELCAELSDKEIFHRRIAFPSASHSQLVEPLLPRLEAELVDLAPMHGDVTFASSVTGSIAGSDTVLDGAYWVRNMRDPVLFDLALGALGRAGHGIYLEIAPHPILALPMSETLTAAGSDVTVVPAPRRGPRTRYKLYQSAGQLHASGAAVRHPGLAAAARANRTHGRGRPCTTSPAMAVDGGDLAHRLRAIIADCVPVDLAAAPEKATFRDLGVDSIAALTLARRVEVELGIHLSVASIFGKTVGEILVETSPNSPASGQTLLCLRRSASPRLGVVLLPGAGGTALMMAPWAETELAARADVYAINPPGHGHDSRPLLNDFASMVDLYSSCLSELTVPLVLVGYSMGGLVAAALAARARAAGAKLAAVVLVNTTAPGALDSAENRHRRARWLGQADSMYDELGVAATGISRERFLEVLLVDLRAIDGCDRSLFRRLDCLGYIVASRDDVVCTVDDALEWAAFFETAETFVGTGAHHRFLDHSSNRSIIRQIAARLAPGPGNDGSLGSTVAPYRST